METSNNINIKRKQAANPNKISGATFENDRFIFISIPAGVNGLPYKIQFTIHAIYYVLISLKVFIQRTFRDLFHVKQISESFFLL